MGEVHFCTTIRHLYMSPTLKRGKEHKEVAHPIAFVFIIVTLRLTRFRWERLAGLHYLLLARLIDTYERLLRDIGTMIDIQHVFHGTDKCRIGFGRNTPLLF